MNQIMVINPYKYHGQWVFDDEAKELDKEPFVAGADTLLDILTNNASNCQIVFSKDEFPDYDLKVEKVGPGMGNGTDYKFYFNNGQQHWLWLCPALLKYFNDPPQTIYFKLKMGTVDLTKKDNRYATNI